MMQSIKNIEIEIKNNKIIFYFNSNIQKDSFLNYKREFQNIYNTLGVTRIIEFDVTKKDNVDVNKEFEHEINQRIMNASNAENNESQQHTNRYPTRNNFSSNEPATEVEICTLTQNDKNISINAKIFAIEEKEYNNRLIMSYYVTDYKDSISVKAFEGSKLNRETLKSLKKGDWVKIKGNITYDNYDNLTIYELKDMNGNTIIKESNVYDAYNYLNSITYSGGVNHIYSYQYTIDSQNLIRRIGFNRGNINYNFEILRDTLNRNIGKKIYKDLNLPYYHHTKLF